MDRITLDIEAHLKRHLATLGALLGHDPDEPWHRTDLLAVAERWADQLADETTADRAAGDLLNLVDLDDPKQAASPLGIRLATFRADEQLTRRQAATILRVTTNQVHNLVKSGLLEQVPPPPSDLGKPNRHRPRGVTRGSVAQRLTTVQPRTYRGAGAL